MLIKPITYTDYDGETRTENFHFNLTKAELAELNLTTEGGLQNVIRNIINSKDVPEITKWFKKIITMSYGQKSADGRRFIKSQELTDEFLQTEAYSELFINLLSDEKEATDFIDGILPKMDQPAISAPPIK